MSELPERRLEPPDEQGISLDGLSQAFAQAMSRGESSEADRPTEEVSGQPDVTPEPEFEGLPVAGVEESSDDDPCPVCPGTILEAMLFVGDLADEPLSAARAAKLMRGVEPDEIPGLVDELNSRYTDNGCPYRVAGQGSGYRLSLHRAYHGVRNKFYGRVREAQLSQAAVDVLAIVAYRQPLSAEIVSQLRGTPSSHLLGQLVRRRLLRMERPEGKGQRPLYLTTDRFLELFNLQGLEDLPQAEELDSR